MNKLLSVTIIVLVLCNVLMTPCTLNAQDSNSLNSVINSAETFFLSLRSRDYKTAWNLLSKKSQETIIDDVYKASRKIGADTTNENIRQDFNNSGVISQNYWNAFLDSFDPDMILENSRWEIGFIRERSAEIIIKQKKSENPARLKMLNEDRIWKVCLVESFWTRKLYIGY